MRITSKGQVTIPVQIREQLGLHPGVTVTFEIVEGSLRMTRAEDAIGHGRSVIERLRGTATTRLSTDEIMSLTRSQGD